MQPNGVGGSVSRYQRMFVTYGSGDVIYSTVDCTMLLESFEPGSGLYLTMKAGRKSKQYHSQSQRATTLGHLQQAERAAQQHNTKRLFGIVKRMIPWKSRSRIMLRQPDGAPMSLLQEHRALVQHCQQLFAPEVDKPVRQGVELTMPVTAMDFAAQTHTHRQGRASGLRSGYCVEGLFDGTSNDTGRYLSSVSTDKL